ncbi:MAG: hypothetical protein IJO58_01645 [Clostridia bacterium]|nr:hypothetical protein [Clostridia bacterium]
MKKILSLLLVSLIIFSFASCGEKQQNNVSSEIVSIVEYNKLVPEYASKGMIDTVIFPVGASVDEVVEHYNGNGPAVDEHGAHLSSDEEVSDADTSSETISIPELDDEITYDLTIRGLDTGDRIIKMYSYDTRYFYYNASPMSGIAYIAQSIDSFGYMIGHSTYTDVKGTIEAQPVSDKIAENDDMFFMVEPLVNSKMLSYQYGDYMLNFFFDSNDKLFYTTIYNVHVWTE